MTAYNITHAMFVIERDLRHPPAKVFAAYADPAKKSKWFGGPPEWEGKHTMDFRVGGKETSQGGPPGGVIHKMSGVYWDIVENERIVMSYEMRLDATRISVSLGTTEIKPNGAGAKIIYTEQGVYLDGYDDAGQREEGTRELIGKLESYLNA
ncbi:MAG: polyketide cyclase [Proteobacteria bacterium HN_bin10]|nr:MAG: polyketide cyclase [Proteobacteria bacterium HN_bin10]